MLPVQHKRKNMSSRALADYQHWLCLILNAIFKHIIIRSHSTYTHVYIRKWDRSMFVYLMGTREEEKKLLSLSLIACLKYFLWLNKNKIGSENFCLDSVIVNITS